MSAELLPCPFCGSDGEVEIYDNRGTFVQCCGCFARAESVEAWNRRAPDPPLEQMAEALREAMEWNWLEENVPENIIEKCGSALSAYNARKP